MRTYRQTALGAVALLVSGAASLGCDSSTSGGSCEYWNGTWAGSEVDSYGGDLGPASMVIAGHQVDVSVTSSVRAPEELVMTASCNDKVVPHQIKATITGGNHPEAVGRPVYGIFELDTTTMSGMVAMHRPGMTSYPTSFTSDGSTQRLFVFERTGGGAGGSAGAGSGGRTGSGGTGGKGGSGGGGATGGAGSGGAKATGGAGAGGRGAAGDAGVLACNGATLPVATGSLSIADNFVTTGDLQGYAFTWVSSSPPSTCITPACTSSGCTPTFSGSALCAAGTVAADQTYTSGAVFGFNVNQTKSSSAGLTRPAPAGITVSYTNPGRTPLRMQLSSDTSSSPTIWCRVLVSDSGSTVVASGTTIPIGEFNTKCWDGSGSALSAGTAIAGIAFSVPSKATVETPFGACLTGVQFVNPSTGDGGPPRTDSSGAGGAGGSNLDVPSGTGGTDDAGQDETGSGGQGGLLAGAEPFQGPYPTPGPVTYVDTDGQDQLAQGLPGLVLLFVSPDVGRAEVESLLGASGASVKAALPALGFYLAGVSPGSEGQLITALRADVRTLVAMPDIVVGIEAARVLHTLDLYCPSSSIITDCPTTGASQDRKCHGQSVLNVFSRYVTVGTFGICDPVSRFFNNPELLSCGVDSSGNPKGCDATSAICWSIAQLLDSGSTFINVSLGPGRTTAKEQLQKKNPVYPTASPEEQKKIEDRYLVDNFNLFWQALFTQLAAAKLKAPQPDDWDVVLTVSAGNDQVDVSAAVQAVQRDPFAGDALGTNGIIVGATPGVFAGSNTASGFRDLVLATNEEASKGTSFAAPYALARTSNLATGDVSGSKAVCVLKKAAAENAQVLPTSDPDVDSLCTLAAERVAAGEFHTCTAQIDGTVRCWGLNTPGQLGSGSMFTVFSATPVMTQTITTADSVAAGYDHSCAVLTGGKVWCWGNNKYGQLGSDATATPYSYTPIQVPAVRGAIAAAGGYDHTCALIRNGTVSCWGDNSHGELGNGSTQGSASPVTVPLGYFATAVAAGHHHACAVLGDGTVRCWGNNQEGELGNGTTVASSTPVLVSLDKGGFLTGAQAVTAACCEPSGYSHTCALLDGGTVWCWGNNQAGQLGDKSSTVGNPADSGYQRSLYPVQVKNLSGATALAAGELHTCALLGDGTVRCWGSDAEGELGDNGKAAPATKYPDPDVPDSEFRTVLVSGISNAIAIAASGLHTCAVLQGGAVACWGMNEMGQLGNGSQSPSPVPVRVAY